MRAVVGLVSAIALALTTGVAAAAPAQAAMYDPTFVSAGYTLPVCFNGVLDNDSVVTSFNDPGGLESITFSLDGAPLPGFPYALATGDSHTFTGVVPADTPVGNHTLTVDNYGFTLDTYTFTLNDPCVAISEFDFSVNLYNTKITLDGTLSRDIELNSMSLASRQATVWVDDVLVWAPVVPANGLLTFTFTPPTCQSYTVKVSFGFPTLAYDSVEPAYGCPSPVTVAAVGDASTLEADVTVTNGSAAAIQFVVFAYTDNGNRIDKTPSPGDTSFSLAVGESVTFHATVNPLPAGDTSYYFSLQPVIGDGEIGRSNWITDVPPPVIYTAPTVTGTSTVGSQLTCSGATYSPNVNSVTYGWLRNGVLIDGATQGTYTLVAADAGTSVSCKVTASDGFTFVTATSPAVAVASVQSLPVRTSGPTRAGTLRVGSVQTCNVVYTGALSGTFAWKANGVLIPGATKRTFTLTYAQLNKHITCLTSASNASGTTPTVSSASSAVVALGLAPHIVSAKYNPTVVGAVARGKTVKAYVGRWTAPVPTAYGYQWLVDGKAIKGATKSSFKIPASYKNHKISVRITAIKTGYTKGYKTSVAIKVK
jgi:hypothetical protein